MFKLTFDGNEAGKINVKVVPSTIDNMNKNREIMHLLEVENPLITHGIQEYEGADTLFYADDNSLEKICAEMCWTTEEGRMYKSLNALTLLQNAFTCLLNDERLIEKLINQLNDDAVKITPEFEFHEDRLVFGFSYGNEHSKAVMEDAMIFSDFIDTRGYKENERKFIEWAFGNTEFMSMSELILRLVSIAWDSYRRGNR